MPQARDEAGNVWEVDAQGNPIRLVQAAQQGQVFDDPGAPASTARGNADAASAGAGAAVDQATIDARIRQERAAADEAEANAAIARRSAARGTQPELTATQREAAIMAQTDASAIRAIVQDLRQRYQEGPGATSGIWGVQDYFPTADNKNFDDAGQRARGYVKRALGFTGGEGNTLAESAALYDPFLPRAGDRDEQIVAKIDALEGLANRTEQQAGSLLGISPGPSAMDQTFIQEGADLQASGGRGTTSEPIPPEMQQEYQAWVLGNISSATPESYAAFRQGLDRKYGYGSVADYTTEGQRIIDGFQNGGTLNLTIPPIEREMTQDEAGRDSLINSPVGAALGGLANMGSFGAVEALAGDQFATLRNERPVATTLGEIAGSVSGVSALGRLGANTLGRAAPRLLGGGGRAQFGRNLATDVAYSGTYGGVTGQGAGETAVEGGVGSVLGQGVGGVLGRAIRGVNVDPAVEYLRSRNIPLTTGQTIGGMADRVEQKAMSIPLLGDMVRNRRVEGLEAFNQEALNEAGAPIGARTTAIGREGLDQMQQSVGDAYNSATAGVNVPIDDQFLSEFEGMVQGADNLPEDARRRLGQVLNVRVQPLANAGAITGDSYQQAMRGLSSARNSPPQQFAGFEDLYRDSVTSAQDVLTDQMMRGGGDNVVTGLRSANAANRNLRTVEDAANRNIGGSNTDTPFVFTPSQLQRAGLKTQQKFPGARPFAELADNAQQVLPQTIPNSGTADRAMQAGLGALLATGGAAGGLAIGGDAQSAGTGAAIPTAAMILAALGGTRQGQRAINAMLTQRAPSARALGESVRRNSGLFGSAAIPLTLSRD